MLMINYDHRVVIRIENVQGTIQALMLITMFNSFIEATWFQL